MSDADKLFESLVAIALRVAAHIQAQSPQALPTAQTSAPVPGTSLSQPSPQAEYLNTKQTAVLLGVGRKTLEGWRANGRGPKFVKLPGAVRYSRADLDAWLKRNSR